jgi:hypothetical protein
MPFLLRLLVGCALAFIAGAVVTPLVWGPVLVQQSKQILSPFALISAGIFLAALGYAIGQIRKK